MTRSLLFGLLLAALGALPAPGDAPGWSHLRGPSYDGTSDEEGMLTSWPDAGPTVWWRRKIGQGFSGAVTAGRRLYTQAQDAAGQYVLCLELASGRTLWRQRYGLAWGGKWPGPYATPTVADGKVYFAGCYGRVGCLVAETGAWVWSRELDELGDRRGTDFGYASTPLILDGKVFFQVGAKGASVVALDAATGAIAWQTGDDAASYAPPFLIRVDGAPQLISLMQQALIAHDPATGKELWRQQWGKGGYDERSAMPVYSAPYLFCSAPFRGGARVLRVGATSAEPVWASDVLSADVCSPVVVGDHVYGYDVHDAQAGQNTRTRGAFKCVEIATGKERWSHPMGLASVVAVRDRLLLWTESGLLILAEATPEGWRERQRAQLAETGRCWTAPIYDRGCLILRAEEELICVDLGANRERLATTQRRQLIALDVLLPRWIDSSAARPGWQDHALWLLIAIVLTALSLLAGKALNARRQLMVASLCMAGLGPVLLPLLGAAGLGFVFTWPLTLLGGLCFVIIRGNQARRDEMSRGEARLALFGFLVVGCSYVVACSGWNILIGWAFLPATLLASPFLVLAARQRRGHWRRWLLLAVVTCYGGAAALAPLLPVSA